MTTATKDPPERWTLREVAKQESTLTDLRERLERLRDEKDALGNQIVEEIAGGGDVDELRARQRAVSDELTELGAAEPVLAEKVAERRFLARQALAERRLGAIADRVSRLVSEARRRAAKAAELTEALETELRFLAYVGLHRKLLAAEAGALERGYGLDGPDRDILDVDGRRILADARRVVHGVEPPRDSIAVAKSDVELIRMLVRLFDEDTPTVGLLNALKEPGATS